MMEDFGVARRFAAGQVTLLAERHALSADQRVRIRSGPWQGSEGVIVDRPEGGRLLIRLDGMLRGVYLQVVESLVELA